MEHPTGRVQLGQDWIQTRLLYEDCGLAYIVVNVAESSPATILLTIDEQDFKDKGYFLLKPHKGKGLFKLEVTSGTRQLLVLARVDTSERRELEFPPASLSITEK
jgi:hypothetical protein